MYHMIAATLFMSFMHSGFLVSHHHLRMALAIGCLFCSMRAIGFSNQILACTRLLWMIWFLYSISTASANGIAPGSFGTHLILLSDAFWLVVTYRGLFERLNDDAWLLRNFTTSGLHLDLDRLCFR